MNTVTIIKRWSPEDQVTLDRALSTGLLPDGRIATQERLALYLGFHRNTIVTKLAGRRFPLCVEVMKEAGRRGGVECHRRGVGVHGGRAALRRCKEMRLR